MNPSIAQILLTHNAALAAAEYPTMTVGAWLYMLIVWGAIIALNVFCFGRMFSKKE